MHSMIASLLRCIEAEFLVRPLVVTSLQLQRDQTSLADAVLSYLNIYVGFDKSRCRHELIPIIEKR
ncbi:hypothetical protein ACHHYP_20455 [Achlya hypogyna]|uniref:Uncharacterized protein n=1 Tax=Achlya hypogyna TaxID=1202772 RepID=A0A1V9ZIE1_ACHHY|nr:hypothetical protein ACHHYP_20455 [Achlya hypogyna]